MIMFIIILIGMRAMQEDYSTMMVNGFNASKMQPVSDAKRIQTIIRYYNKGKFAIFSFHFISYC